MKLLRVQSMYTMTSMYHLSKDRHIGKFKKVIRHITLIRMNRRLFWMHLEVHKVVQGAVHVHRVVHVHHDLLVPGQAHREVQEGHDSRGPSN
jgi:hypothetical protein